MYRLKPGQDSFEIVDGPGAGLKFLRGKVYDGKTIPKQEAWRFEPLAGPKKKTGDEANFVTKTPDPDKTPVEPKKSGKKEK